MNMSDALPVVVCYKRDKKYYWSIKSKGYDTKEEALAAVPTREKNKLYNGDLGLKTKGEKNNGRNRKEG